MATHHYIDESDYENVVEVTDGVYWIGFYDITSDLQCNPYLVIDGAEAVVIDGGSRPDFPTVMLKILQTGLDPASIKALIYHHYDPDLCGSISNFEDIIDNPDLKIISHKENNMYIRHYGISSQLYSHDDLGKRYIFSSGRVLEFINTPYSHSSGSFVTFDHKNGVMFTSDLFGSYGAGWRLFLHLKTECRQCETYTDCHLGKMYCPIPDIQRFHKEIMTSEKALEYAIRKVMEYPISIVAPQHGSIIDDRRDIEWISKMLISLKGIGIDGVLADESGVFKNGLQKALRH